MYIFPQKSTRPILSVNETTHLSHNYLRHQHPIIWAHENTTPFPLHKLRRNFLQIAKIIPSASTKVKEKIMCFDKIFLVLPQFCGLVIYQPM